MQNGREDKRFCKMCGAVVEGKRWYCDKCRAKKDSERRKKMNKKTEIVQICARCGKKFVTHRRADRDLARHCPDCQHLVAGETRKAKREEMANREKSQRMQRMPGLAPMNRPLYPEPRNKDTLEHDVWIVEVLNRYRAAKKMKTLSYGEYSVQRAALEAETKLAVDWAQQNQKFYIKK